MPIPAFALGALKSAAINKGLDAVNAPQGVRNVVGFATDPKGFVRGAIKDAVVEGATNLMRGDSNRGDSGGTSGGGRSSRVEEETEEIDAFKKGGKVKSASKRADGCCKRGKTRGKIY